VLVGCAGWKRNGRSRDHALDLPVALHAVATPAPESRFRGCDDPGTRKNFHG
jgi:hypothetical protein